MASSNPCLWVSVDERTAFLKICGRATFNQSVDFKRFAYETLHRGCRNFVLDLSGCLIMDSTFLGVLAGFGHKATATADGHQPATITLVNPNGRVADLLDNLGVSPLFKVLHCTPAEPACYEPAETAGASKVDLARTCLEAHETLMALHPANISKFKDVTQFFAEDLERLQKAADSSTPPRDADSG